MYFQILLKDFVRNVHLEDVSANTDGPLLFTCFGGRRKCGVWWAIMPWFQEPARWEWVESIFGLKFRWSLRSIFDKQWEWKMSLLKLPSTILGGREIRYIQFQSPNCFGTYAVPQVHIFQDCFNIKKIWRDKMCRNSSNIAQTAFWYRQVVRQSAVVSQGWGWVRAMRVIGEDTWG